MIKIEQLLDGAVATYTTADGAESTVFAGQLISEADLATLKVTSGKLVYSVNESELVEVAASAPAPVAPKAAKAE